MICTSCGKKSYAVFRCGNCDDLRCLKCEGKSSSGSSITGSYNQLSCVICKKREVKRLNWDTWFMSQFIIATCNLLVEHFSNIMLIEDSNGYGFNSRVFSHLLHPEEKFILEGYSLGAISGEPIRLEHLVPCKVLYNETRRLLTEGQLSKHEIALLLQKHWRVAYITKSEQEKLDSQYKLKTIMPSEWVYETGDTLARLKVAKIELQPLPCQIPAT